MESTTIPESFVKLVEEGRCCICGAPLKGGHVNLVSVLKMATWDFPIWANMFTPEMGYRAMAITCDACVDDETGIALGEPTEVIEVHEDGTYLYHDVADLEDAENITEEMVKAGQERLQKEVDTDEQLGEALPLEISNIETNLEMLRQSELYLIVLSNSYLDSLEDPRSPGHISYITQLELARATQKKTLILYDSRVKDRIEHFKETYLGGINLISIDEYNIDSEEDRRKVFDAALRKLQEA